MTYKEYRLRISDAKTYASAADYLAEYGFPADCEFTADGLVKAFDIIFAVSRCDFPQLVEHSGGNLSALCRLFNIPLRTAQRWAAGERQPTEYLIELIGYAMISECEKEGDLDQTQEY